MNSLPATPDTDRGSSTVVGKGLLKRWIWMSNEYHHATLGEMTGQLYWRLGCLDHDIVSVIPSDSDIHVTVV